MAKCGHQRDTFSRILFAQVTLIALFPPPLFSLFSPLHHRSLCRLFLPFIISDSRKGTRMISDEIYRSKRKEEKKVNSRTSSFSFDDYLAVGFFFYRRFFISRDILREIEYDISKSRLSKRGEKNTLPFSL